MALVGATIEKLTTYRSGLRYPFPNNFSDITRAATITTIKRMGKYLIIRLDTHHSIISHLGMSGRYKVIATDRSFIRHKHDHFIVSLKNGLNMVYNDPRRFGYVLAVKTSEERSHPVLSSLGLDPFSPSCTLNYLFTAFGRRRISIKQALLNQSILAGIGNIYACEALWRAKIDPRLKACDLTISDVDHLLHSIKETLEEAIKSGGSSINTHRTVDGKMGYFQQDLRVYGRSGKPCPGCHTPITSIRQGNRSTFYCPKCQKHVSKKS